MKIKNTAPALFVSSLMIFGCQPSQVDPDQETDAKVESTKLKYPTESKAQLEPKPEEALTDKHDTEVHKPQASKLIAKDVKFIAVPFDYKLPKDVADKCVESDTYLEDEIGCPNIDITLAQVTPKWIEQVINLQITDDNSSQYIKFKRHLDAFARSQIEDGSPMSYSEMIQPKQLAPHNNVVQFSVLSDLYLGGAHGMPNITYLIFDMDMQTQIGLYDVLDDPEDRFYDLVRNEFVSYLANEMQIETPEQIADYEQTWPFALSEEFYFDDKGLVMVYQPYELGSFAQGFIELTVPYESLQGVVRDEYL